MSENTQTKYRLAQTLAMTTIILSGAVLVWSINKILSLVMVMIALYVFVTRSELVPQHTMHTTAFEGHSVQLSPRHTVDSIEHFIEANRAIRRGRSTRVSYIPSSLYDSDTTPLSEPRSAMEIELPLPPSVVVDNESITDQDFSNVGIRTLDELADVDSYELDDELPIDEDTIEDLIYQANMLYYGAGVHTLMDLIMMTPDEIVHKILTSEYRDVFDDVDPEVLLEMAERWIKKGKTIMTRSLSDFFRGR